jgi:K+-transporting ATPase ATPase C chain
MNDILHSLRLFTLSLAVCSGVYPIAVAFFADMAAPEAALGSLIHDKNGKIVGSRLLAQKFTRPEYFWPRPSACDYNASATGGSNLSPTNSKLTARAREIIERLQLEAGQSVPADLVSASGSGMDPHITRGAALLQAARVAQARGLPVEQVERLVDAHRDAPALTRLGGEPVINVLELNLALDAQGK